MHISKSLSAKLFLRIKTFLFLQTMINDVTYTRNIYIYELPVFSYKM